MERQNPRKRWRRRPEQKGGAEAGPEKPESERKADIRAEWTPRTELGKLVRDGKIESLDQIYGRGMRVMEHEVIDYLTTTKSDLISIGQSKGKFGGGKRRAWRQTQRKTAEGNVPSFSCMAVVGNERGYVGLGYGKSKETLPAREKALKRAKISMIKVNRGCGSFECGCNEEHSIPFKVEAKAGSSKIVLMPAPKGTGLVLDKECIKILKLAGIKDVYSKTFGQTRTKMNLAMACLNALERTTKLVR